MSIEKITSKIISDAEISAKNILEQAKNGSDEILDEARKKAEDIQQRGAESGRVEKDKLISRRKSVADIDGRKIILEEKQKLIAECFDQALEKIISMEKEDYVQFLVNTVKRTGMTEGQLLMNEKDAAAVGADLVARIAKELPGSTISLSTENRKVRGGFLLKNGSVYINGTIEAMMDQAREDLVGEVAKQLFQ